MKNGKDLFGVRYRRRHRGPQPQLGPAAPGWPARSGPNVKRAGPKRARTTPYRAALRLIRRISNGLDSRTLHLRDSSGLLLDKLDQVLVAIEDRRWPAQPPFDKPFDKLRTQQREENRNGNH